MLGVAQQAPQAPPSNDRLVLLLDGSEVWSQSGRNRVGRAKVSVGPGAHTLRFACIKDEQVNLGLDRAWVDDVELFAGGDLMEHHEVSLALVNHADQAFSIDGLGKGEVVRLVDDQGRLAPLHRVSVGLAKPIRVRPRATVKTSLLFAPLRGRPMKLQATATPLRPDVLTLFLLYPAGARADDVGRPRAGEGAQVVWGFEPGPCRAAALRPPW